MRFPALVLFIILFVGKAGAQEEEDLLALLDSVAPPKKEFVIATFKGVRLINGHTVQIPATGEMAFLIGHRFGNIKDGVYNFFGLDQAGVRLGFEYSPVNRLCIGIGRGVYQKSIDGLVKFQLLRQATGPMASPVSVTWLSSASINTLKWANPDRKNYPSSRMAYVHQLLIARKFSSDFSLQLMPTLVHKNLVEKQNDLNDIFALGIGGRYKLTRRVSINAEYFQLLQRNRVPQTNGLPAVNCLALGVDIETGGHVFQLHFTNTQAMIEKAFITETTGPFFKGNIFFGFNVTRIFNLHH